MIFDIQTISDLFEMSRHFLIFQDTLQNDILPPTKTTLATPSRFPTCSCFVISIYIGEVFAILYFHEALYISSQNELPGAL